jgi:hypothetical protein
MSSLDLQPENTLPQLQKSNTELPNPIPPLQSPLNSPYVGDSQPNLDKSDDLTANQPYIFAPPHYQPRFSTSDYTPLFPIHDKKECDFFQFNIENHSKPPQKPCCGLDYNNYTIIRLLFAFRQVCGIVVTSILGFVLAHKYPSFYLVFPFIILSTTFTLGMSLSAIYGNTIALMIGLVINYLLFRFGTVNAVSVGLMIPLPILILGILWTSKVGASQWKIFTAFYPVFLLIGWKKHMTEAYMVNLIEICAIGMALSVGIVTIPYPLQTNHHVDSLVRNVLKNSAHVTYLITKGFLNERHNKTHLMDYAKSTTQVKKLSRVEKKALHKNKLAGSLFEPHIKEIKAYNKLQREKRRLKREYISQTRLVASQQLNNGSLFKTTMQGFNSPLVNPTPPGEESYPEPIDQQLFPANNPNNSQNITPNNDDNDEMDQTVHVSSPTLIPPQSTKSLPHNISRELYYSLHVQGGRELYVESYSDELSTSSTEDDMLLHLEGSSITDESDVDCTGISDSIDELSLDSDYFNNLDCKSPQQQNSLKIQNKALMRGGVYSTPQTKNRLEFNSPNQSSFGDNSIDEIDSVTTSISSRQPLLSAAISDQSTSSHQQLLSNSDLFNSVSRHIDTNLSSDSENDNDRLMFEDDSPHDSAFFENLYDHFDRKYAPNHPQGSLRQHNDLKYYNNTNTSDVIQENPNFLHVPFPELYFNHLRQVVIDIENDLDLLQTLGTPLKYESMVFRIIAILTCCCCGRFKWNDFKPLPTSVFKSNDYGPTNINNHFNDTEEKRQGDFYPKPHWLYPNIFSATSFFHPPYNSNSLNAFISEMLLAITNVRGMITSLEKLKKLNKGGLMLYHFWASFLRSDLKRLSVLNKAFITNIINHNDDIVAFDSAFIHSMFLISSQPANNHKGQNVSSIINRHQDIFSSLYSILTKYKRIDKDNLKNPTEEEIRNMLFVPGTYAAVLHQFRNMWYQNARIRKCAFFGFSHTKAFPSQNGKTKIYKTRTITEPIFTFSPEIGLRSVPFTNQKSTLVYKHLHSKFKEHGDTVLKSRFTQLYAPQLSKLVLSGAPSHSSSNSPPSTRVNSHLSSKSNQNDSHKPRIKTQELSRPEYKQHFQVTLEDMALFNDFFFNYDRFHTKLYCAVFPSVLPHLCPLSLVISTVPSSLSFPDTINSMAHLDNSNGVDDVNGVNDLAKTESDHQKNPQDQDQTGTEIVPPTAVLQNNPQSTPHCQPRVSATSFIPTKIPTYFTLPFPLTSQDIVDFLVPNMAFRFWTIIAAVIFSVKVAKEPEYDASVLSFPIPPPTQTQKTHSDENNIEINIDDDFDHCMGPRPPFPPTQTDQNENRHFHHQKIEYVELSCTERMKRSWRLFVTPTPMDVHWLKFLWRNVITITVASFIVLIPSKFQKTEYIHWPTLSAALLMNDSIGVGSSLGNVMARVVAQILGTFFSFFVVTFAARMDRDHNITTGVDGAAIIVVFLSIAMAYFSYARSSRTKEMTVTTAAPTMVAICIITLGSYVNQDTREQVLHRLEYNLYAGVLVILSALFIFPTRGANLIFLMMANALRNISKLTDLNAQLITQSILFQSTRDTFSSFGPTIFPIIALRDDNAIQLDLNEDEYQQIMSSYSNKTDTNAVYDSFRRKIALLQRCDEHIYSNIVNAVSTSQLRDKPEHNLPTGNLPTAVPPQIVEITKERKTITTNAPLLHPQPYKDDLITNISPNEIYKTKIRIYHPFDSRSRFFFNCIATFTQGAMSLDSLGLHLLPYPTVVNPSPGVDLASTHTKTLLEQQRQYNSIQHTNYLNFLFMYNAQMKQSAVQLRNIGINLVKSIPSLENESAFSLISTIKRSQIQLIQSTIIPLLTLIRVTHRIHEVLYCYQFTLISLNEYYNMAGGDMTTAFKSILELNYETYKQQQQNQTAENQPQTLTTGGVGVGVGGLGGTNNGSSPIADDQFDNMFHMNNRDLEELLITHSEKLLSGKLPQMNDYATALSPKGQKPISKTELFLYLKIKTHQVNKMLVAEGLPLFLSFSQTISLLIQSFLSTIVSLAQQTTVPTTLSFALDIKFSHPVYHTHNTSDYKIYLLQEHHEKKLRNATQQLELIRSNRNLKGSTRKNTNELKKQEQKIKELERFKRLFIENDEEKWLNRPYAYGFVFHFLTFSFGPCCLRSTDDKQTIDFIPSPKPIEQPKGLSIESNLTSNPPIDVEMGGISPNGGQYTPNCGSPRPTQDELGIAIPMESVSNVPQQPIEKIAKRIDYMANSFDTPLPSYPNPQYNRSERIALQKRYVYQLIAYLRQVRVIFQELSHQRFCGYYYTPYPLTLVNIEHTFLSTLEQYPDVFIDIIAQLGRLDGNI